MAVLLALAAIWTRSAGLDPYWPVICVAFAGFSFYRSYKAFVEVWRSRLSKRVEIQVTADKSTCLPGDVAPFSPSTRSRAPRSATSCSPRPAPAGGSSERSGRY